MSSVLALLLWIAAIRFNPELFHYSPAIPWLLSALLVAGSSFAANRLSIGSAATSRAEIGASVGR